MWVKTVTGVFLSNVIADNEIKLPATSNKPNFNCTGCNTVDWAAKSYN